MYCIIYAEQVSWENFVMINSVSLNRSQFCSKFYSSSKGEIVYYFFLENINFNSIPKGFGKQKECFNFYYSWLRIWKTVHIVLSQDNLITKHT